MKNKNEAPTTSEADPNSAPKDLRAELETDLKIEFAANLLEVGTMPKAVCDALTALLDSNGTTSAVVCAALALEDPTQIEVSNG